MKKFICLFTVGFFVLLLQNASAEVGPNDHHGDQDAPHCAAMGMADGSPHVDPPQAILDRIADK